MCERGIHHSRHSSRVRILLDAPTPAHPFSKHLGCRTPAHLNRWFSALLVGRQVRRCAAVTRTTGRACRGPVRRHAEHCRWHCTPRERAEADRLRLPEIEQLLKRPMHPVPRSRIEATRNAILRRNLRRAWRRDPTVAGATITLDPRDEARVRDFLLYVAGIRLEDLATPRAIDNCRWAAALAIAKRSSEALAMRRIARALRDERRWLEQSL
jgi:hypothetical protein